MVAAAEPGAAPGPAAQADRPLVLYDGTCGLCARSVRWLLRHERDHALVFAPLQGETTAALRATHPTIPETIDTVILVANGKVHLRSKAFLYLAVHLRAPWRWAYAFRWFPGFLLDLGYRMIAALRYRIWGRVDACEVPAPAQRARFLP
jgi:predicted DCC family thiol-disulfide oxidoreductase YuxK